jgi:hypothetical protein
LTPVVAEGTRELEMGPCHSFRIAASKGYAMSLTTLREELRQARASAAAGDTASAVQRLDQALQQLEPTHLLTVDETARYLGLRSVDIVKYWIHSGVLSGVPRDGQLLVPVSEIERIEDSERVRAIRASDALHDASEELGDEAGLSDEELQVLEESRPGMLPWKRQ